MRKRMCVTANPYSADMVMDRSKSDRGFDTGFYSHYCTAENYPYAPAQMLVDAANRKQNHLNQLTAFKKYTQSGLNLIISCHRVTELNRGTISWALALTRENMHTLYEQSEWGWSEKVKLDELTNRKAWYLLVRTPEGENVAFVHFRFDLDYGIEVLYCYEIQLDKSFRRVGLGQYLMLILELIAKQNRMKKVMLTVFKHNIAGRNFFAKKLRYEVDETSPSCRRTSYEILSKKIIYQQSRSKHLSRQGASSCLRIRMPYSLDRSSDSSTESLTNELTRETKQQFEAPKIKAIVTSHRKTHSQPDPVLQIESQEPILVPQPILMEPNLEPTTKSDEINVPSDLLEPNLDPGIGREDKTSDEEVAQLTFEGNANLEKFDEDKNRENEIDLEILEKPQSPKQ